MNRPFRFLSLFSLLASLLLAGALVGCGDDDDPNTDGGTDASVVVPDGGSDGGMGDAAMGDAGSDAGDAG